MSIFSKTIIHTGTLHTFPINDFFIRFGTKTNVVGNTFKGQAKEIRFFYEVISRNFNIFYLECFNGT